MNRLRTYLKMSLCIITVSACGIMTPRKHVPKAKFCYFDPKNSQIVYTRRSYEGIIRIEILFKFGSVQTWRFYKDVSYQNAVNIINLKDFDGDNIKKYHLFIKIWDKSPIMHDYDLEIKPDDWKIDRRIFFKYNLR